MPGKHVCVPDGLLEDRRLQEENAETLKLNLRKFRRLQACEKLAPFRRISGDTC